MTDVKRESASRDKTSNLRNTGICPMCLQSRSAAADRNSAEDEVRLLRATCDAHCTVIDDLQQGNLHKHNEWLMADWTRRYYALNEQTVKHIERDVRQRRALEMARDYLSGEFYAEALGVLEDAIRTPETPAQLSNTGEG